MNKQIHIYYINRIKDCLLRIFEFEDDDCVDYRGVRANERAIEHWLDKAKIYDTDLRHELYEHIDWTCDACVESLEKLGWTIIRGKENL